MSAESGKGQPVAGLRIVGWMLERDGDESFPRLHKSESEASQWVKASIGSASPVTMRPVYAIEPDSSDPVRAALVEALTSARAGLAQPYMGNPMQLGPVLTTIDAALKAAGVEL